MLGGSRSVDRRRIAMIVSPWYPVPPTGYGGIELMAYHLASELQRRGHEVSVIGQQGSKGVFETIAIAPESWSSQLGTRDQLPRESLFLYRAYDLVRRRAFDVVHDHSGHTGILLAAPSRLQTPVVATLHGDLTEAEGEFLAAIDHRDGRSPRETRLLLRSGRRVGWRPPESAAGRGPQVGCRYGPSGRARRRTHAGAQGHMRDRERGFRGVADREYRAGSTSSPVRSQRFQPHPSSPAGRSRSPRVHGAGARWPGDKP